MPRAGRPLLTVSVLTVVTLCPCTANAQEQIAIQADVLFYGDNTEFRNPFREGETIFGAAARLGVAFELNDRVTLFMGAFGNQRFGSEDAFDEAKPVFSLTVRGKRSAFVFGTLPAPTVETPIGPDRGGPHVLLPPLQRETLSYDRPYEAGLAWTFTGATLHHNFWLNWQRLNTTEHRERFDGGINGELRLSAPASIPFQIHVVHEGGQLHDSGPVADSAAVALGLDLHGMVATNYRMSLELFGLGSRNVPDRSRPALSRDGVAFFGRISAERAAWRAHVIFWRGRNFIKDEGDPNYLSIRRSGIRYRGTRDYAETGLTRRFRLAPSALLEASGRFHRVEGHYEYSYRILSIVRFSQKIK
jgi:hypothetical protein